MQRVSIEFEDIDVRDIDSININFKDGRPTMTKTTTKPNEDGKLITTSVTMPYSTDHPEKKPFTKKAEK